MHQTDQDQDSLEGLVGWIFAERTERSGDDETNYSIRPFSQRNLIKLSIVLLVQIGWAAYVFILMSSPTGGRVRIIGGILFPIFAAIIIRSFQRVRQGNREALDRSAAFGLILLGIAFNLIWRAYVGSEASVPDWIFDGLFFSISGCLVFIVVLSAVLLVISVRIDAVGQISVDAALFGCVIGSFFGWRFIIAHFILSLILLSIYLVATILISERRNRTINGIIPQVLAFLVLCPIHGAVMDRISSFPAVPDWYEGRTYKVKKIFLDTPETTVSIIEPALLEPWGGAFDHPANVEPYQTGRLLENIRMPGFWKETDRLFPKGLGNRLAKPISRALNVESDGNSCVRLRTRVKRKGIAFNSDLLLTAYLFVRKDEINIIIADCWEDAHRMDSKPFKVTPPFRLPIPRRWLFPAEPDGIVVIRETAGKEYVHWFVMPIGIESYEHESTVEYADSP